MSWFPEKGPELWAYPSTILNAAHSYEGATWVTHDRLFRREMLAWKDLNWSVPNSRLYNEAFTGRAKIMQRCQHCLLEDHGSTGCPQHPNPMLVGWFHPPVSLPQLASVAAAVPTPPSTSPKTPGAEVCRNFHADRCRFSCCLFVHSCSDCAGPPELLTLAGSTSIAGAAAQPAFQKGPQQPPVPLRYPKTRGPRRHRPALHSRRTDPPYSQGRIPWTACIVPIIPCSVLVSPDAVIYHLSSFIYSPSCIPVCMLIFQFVSYNNAQ